MPSPGRRAALLRGALAIFGAWTVYGLVHAGFWLATIAASTPGRGLWAWRWVLPAAMILAWSWAVLTPGVFRLTKAVAPGRVGWPWSLTVHAVTFAVLALAMAWLRVTLLRQFTGQPSLPFWPRAVFWVDVNLFTYLTVVLTGWALQSHRRYVDRALRAHVLETQLARAQLHYLELQLQPHFLFNSLNAIQELAHETPNAAERMLRRLHALLAMSLERSGRDEVTLQEELAALEPYLDIQRTRFEWLRVQIHADDAARASMVPNIILQPLVENAIRHGLAVRQAVGHIEIAAERRDSRLLLTVRDDGVGLAPIAARSRPGIGLRNARDRLRQLYGADHRFELRDAPGGGVLVEIDLPFRAGVAPVGAAPPVDPAPEVALDEIAAWRTGEFTTAMEGPDDERVRIAEAEPLAASTALALAAPAPRPSETRSRAAMPEGVSPRLGPVVWLALAGFWLGAAAFWTGQMHLYVRLESPSDYFGFDPALLKLQLAGALYWIAVSIFVLFVARRFRLYRRRLVRNLAIHLGAAVAASFGFLYVLSVLHVSETPLLSPFNINPLSGNFFVYFGLLAWSHSRDFVAWYRAREVTAAQLTSEIARSRFQALCVRVRPAFLLPTLDLLARLVHLDVPRADRLIARLADVLRLTLEMGREHETTLQQELHLLAATVEAHRLGIRPAVTLDVEADPAALTTTMPSRLLCTMVDDLLGADPDGAAAPLAVHVRAERAPDATRIRLHVDTSWKSGDDMHAWWRTKSAADAAVADAGPLVTVAFPDRSTAVLIIADARPAEEPAAVAA